MKIEERGNELVIVDFNELEAYKIARKIEKGPVDSAGTPTSCGVGRHGTLGRNAGGHWKCVVVLSAETQAVTRGCDCRRAPI